MNTSLKKRSQVDPLTQILNRRGLMEIIGEKNPYDHNITLIIIDIDKFKNINDTYGHNVGDSVLVELSSLVKERTVDEDILVRWGGEEFVVVVYTEDLNITQNIAEELREAIEEHEFTTVKKVTASFGVSKAKNQAESFADIFEKADKALYDAKQMGRNRVCTW
jgi:Amt family ammonium transporter